MLRLIYILIILSSILSCKTYERATTIDAWTDNRDVRYYVYEVRKYNRESDTLIEIRLDTITVDWYDTKEFELPYFK